MTEPAPIFTLLNMDVYPYGLCVALAALVFVAVELEKAWRRHRARAAAPSAPKASAA